MTALLLDFVTLRAQAEGVMGDMADTPLMKSRPSTTTATIVAIIAAAAAAIAVIASEL